MIVEPPWTERHQHLADMIAEMHPDWSAMSILLLVHSGVDWHEGLSDMEILTASCFGHVNVAAAIRAGDIRHAPRKLFVLLTGENASPWDEVVP